jgi:hypothetical protein
MDGWTDEKGRKVAAECKKANHFTPLRSFRRMERTEQAGFIDTIYILPVVVAIVFFVVGKDGPTPAFRLVSKTSDEW